MLLNAFGLQNRVATSKPCIGKGPGSVSAPELCLGIVWKGIIWLWPEPSWRHVSQFNIAVIESWFPGLVPDTAQLTCVVIPRSSGPNLACCHPSGMSCTMLSMLSCWYAKQRDFNRKAFGPAAPAFHPSAASTSCFVYGRCFFSWGKNVWSGRMCLWF